MNNQETTKTFIAKTLFGLESCLATELTNLGAENIQILNRAVLFDAPIYFLYKANLCLRTAIRIIMPIQKFSVQNEQHLYEQLKKIQWQDYFSVDKTLSINVSLNTEIFTHSKFIAQKSKDAIADYFREKTGNRPYVDLVNPEVVVDIHIFKNECTVSIDTSGISLHIRSYRTNLTKAPLNEILAAGLVMLSGWNADSDLIDPMCGSGTIVCEAALFAHNIAPNKFRREFAFMNYSFFDRKQWMLTQQEATENERAFHFKILGADVSRRSINMAKENAERAEVLSTIKFFPKLFKNFEPESSSGTVIINPPYGERIELPDLEQFYKSMGDKMKTTFAGYNVWVISTKDALKHLGLHCSKKYTLFNGKLECKYQKYEIYTGTKKNKIYE